MRKTDIAARTAALAAILIGAAGLAGWLFGSEALKSILPGWVTMKANTAVLLAACGGALLLLGAGPEAPNYALRKRAAFFLAALTVLAGALTILEYISGFNFGIDQLLFSEGAGAAYTTHPGRMAAATALCFILTGFGLLLADLRLKRRTYSASEKIALAVLLISFHSLVDYFYGIASGNLSTLHTPMAPHTAAAFICLGAGLILARPGGFVSILQERGIPHTLVLLTLPAAFLVPAAFGWLRLLGETRGFYDVSTGVALSAAFSTAALITVMLYAVKVVRRMDEDLHVTQFSVDNASDLVIWAGPDGRVIYANKAACALLGYAREELTGLSVTDISEIYKTESWASHWAALKDKGAHKYETELRAKGGRLTPVEVNSNYFNPDGREYKCAYARDLTERRRAEKDVRENEERFHLLADNISQLAWMADTQGSIFWYNQRWYDYTGTTLEEMSGWGWQKVHHPDHVQRVVDKIKHCFDTGEVWEDTFPLRGTDGQYRWFLSRAVPIRDEHGTVLRWFGTNTDITERREIEDGLEKTRKELAAAKISEDAAREYAESLINTVREPLIALDQDLRVISASRSFYTIFKVNPDETVGQLIYDLGNRQWDIPKLRELLETILPQKATFDNYEVEHDFADIGMHTMLLNARQIQRALGKDRVILLAMEDITERKCFEAELQQAKKGAEAANLAKREFLSKMSHEIRTPMNAILGFSQLMRRDPAATAPQRERLDIINSSGEHLLELINEVLEISRIESGRLTLNKAAFDLHALLEDLEKLFTAKAQAKDLRMELEISKEVPRFCSGDKGKLRQVLSNILSNAVKFTAQGGVSLRARAVGLGGAGFRLEAEVQDSGPGMTPEEAAGIFKPFEQTQAGRTEGSGTGLGLAISREYAKLMGGAVTVDCRPGGGCVFKVSVIMEEAGQADITEADGIRHVKALKPGQQPCRVLIADDKEDNRTFLAELLGQTGFETRAAADGAQALKEFEAWQPHIILMDLRMPGMDGHEAIKRLRATEKGRAVKIIAVSASAFTEMQQEAKTSGADDFIAKPFREAELFEKIGKLTGLQYIYEDLPPAGPGAAAAEVLKPEMFAGCPPALLDQIREAAVACDFDVIVALSAQVEPVNLKAAQGLRALAQKYDLKGILAAVPEGKE